MTKRGDIVLVDFPFTDYPGNKRRPSLVVQNDSDNQKVRKTVIAMITGNLKRQEDASHLLIDPSTPEGASAGLRGKSLVSCINLYTVEQNCIIRTLSHLSDILKQELNGCLKSALEIS